MATSWPAFFSNRIIRDSSTLKGSLRYFGAREAYQYAFALEEMGRDDSLEGAGAVLGNLQREIAQITTILLDYARSNDLTN